MSDPLRGRSSVQYERFFRDPRYGDTPLSPPASGVACTNIRIALTKLKYEAGFGDRYDEVLSRAIFRFQSDHGHPNRDGVFGPGTRRLLTAKLIEACGTDIFNRLQDPEQHARRTREEQLVAPSLSQFIFVSYRREDLDRVSPLLEQIRNWGYEVWFDKGIPGGAEWDSLIEQKVSQCNFLIAFISRGSAESKWVRREVKFADSQDKPILAILLEESELKHGLKMLLSQYQMLKASDANFLQDLKRALEHISSLS